MRAKKKEEKKQTASKTSFFLEDFRENGVQQHSTAVAVAMEKDYSHFFSFLRSPFPVYAEN